jgi:hypothetical protein
VSVIEITISEEMIATVFDEWQKANPLRSLDDMTDDEFSSRMMEKIKQTARFVEPPEVTT